MQLNSRPLYTGKGVSMGRGLAASRQWSSGLCVQARVYRWGEGMQLLASGQVVSVYRQGCIDGERACSFSPVVQWSLYTGKGVSMGRGHAASRQWSSGLCIQARVYRWGEGMQLNSRQWSSGLCIQARVYRWGEGMQLLASGPVVSVYRQGCIDGERACSFSIVVQWSLYTGKGVSTYGERACSFHISFAIPLLKALSPF